MHAGGDTECEPFHTTARESSGRARAATYSCFRPTIFIFPDPRRVQGLRREIPQADIDRWSIASDNPVGRLRHLGPTVRLRDPPYWARPSVPLGHHEPVWRARTLRPRLPSVDSSPNRAYRAILQTLGTLAQPRVWSASLTPFREFSSLVIGRLRVSEVRGRCGRRWRESEPRL